MSEPEVTGNKSAETLGVLRTILCLPVPYSSGFFFGLERAHVLDIQRAVVRAQKERGDLGLWARADFLFSLYPWSP